MSWFVDQYIREPKISTTPKFADGGKKTSPQQFLVVKTNFWLARPIFVVKTKNVIMTI
jgi:hypothetical protein